MVRIHFPNIPLKLIPLENLSKEIKTVVFKTIPSVTKTEVRNFLEAVYGAKIESVSTANVQGAKMRTKFGYYRRPDYKKVWVTLKEPVVLRGPPTSS